MAHDVAIDEIDDPVLRDAVPCIQTRLVFEVVPQRRVADFDQEQDVLGGRMPVAICIGGAPNERKIQLGLGARHETHWRLNADFQRVVGCPNQHSREQCDHCRVLAADRRHVDDFSLDQFRTIVGRQQADFRHPLVVMNGEPMRPRPAFAFATHGLLIAHTNLTIRANAQRRNALPPLPTIAARSWQPASGSS